MPFDTTDSDLPVAESFRRNAFPLPPAPNPQQVAAIAQGIGGGALASARNFMRMIQALSDQSERLRTTGEYSAGPAVNTALTIARRGFPVRGINVIP